MVFNYVKPICGYMQDCNGVARPCLLSVLFVVAPFTKKEPLPDAGWQKWFFAL